MNAPITFDNEQAVSEGWSIFDSLGSADGRWQLQQIDEAGVFDGDAEAWAHVVWKAVTGNAYHQQALDFLHDNNPAEFLKVWSSDAVRDHALFLQNDARYTYGQADRYRDMPSRAWMAHRVQEAAAVSSLLARRLMGIEVCP